MITAGAEMQVLVATRPVDFRKRLDGLAASCRRMFGPTRSAASSMCSAPSAPTG